MSDVQRAEIAPRELRPLAEHLDDSIEDVSVGVSALLAKIVRQSLRTGIQKLDEGLEENVRHKIEVDLDRRAPELDAAARESARAEVGEQVDSLRKQAKESGAKIVATIESLDHGLREERDTRIRLQEETDEQLRLMRDELSEGFAASQKRGEELERLLAAKLQSAAQSLQGALERLGAASAEQMKELRATVDRQKAVLDKQQSSLAAHEKAIGALRSTLDGFAEVAERTAALEEKVFKPGFFGRLFGRKGPTNAPRLPPPEE
jgi:type I site-specific restriction endonuclease